MAVPWVGGRLDEVPPADLGSTCTPAPANPSWSHPLQSDQHYAATVVSVTLEREQGRARTKSW